MNIFYAIQATGNGHISRAIELLPYLKQYGTVDLFLSGSNSDLQMTVPVKYRSNGLSLFYNYRGGLDYWGMVKGIHPLRLRQEIRDLPVEKYDLVINDFEFITAAACARKKVPSINFGHQASFQSSRTPRPNRKNFVGEFLLKHYAKATRYVGLHFKKYDHFIFPPIIKKRLRHAEPTLGNHITVYLPSYRKAQLKLIFEKFYDHRFEIFCNEAMEKARVGNITFLPVESELFNTSFIHCSGIITGGGFETPAEALYMGKKMMVLPIRGQYEQQCNAAALSEMGIICLEALDASFENKFEDWINGPTPTPMDFSKTTEEVVEYLFSEW